MKRTKRVLSSLLAMIVLVTFIPIVATPPKEAQAQKVYKAGGYACASGNKVFFLAENDTQIKCYNAKTKKVTTVLDSSVDGHFTRGFSDLTVKGKYIYFVWDKFQGSEAGEVYVYRMTLDGKKRTKLACGANPIIAGNKIVYLKCKRSYDSYVGAYITESTNTICSMSLNGKNKKKCSEVATKSVNVYKYYGDTSTGNLGGYVYTLNSDQTSITRKNTTTNKTKTIFSNKNGIISFSVAGNYVYITCQAKNDPVKAVAYVIKSNGTKKAKVASWTMAG